MGKHPRRIELSIAQLTVRYAGISRERIRSALHDELKGLLRAREAGPLLSRSRDIEQVKADGRSMSRQPHHSALAAAMARQVGSAISKGR